MKAMLLAAGLGTRLRPHTHIMPKPLIPVNGIPLILYNLALLKKYGIREVVINLHHLGGQIRDLLGNGKQLGLKIHYSLEPEILGTAGGIFHARRFLQNSPFIVLNGDIIIDVNLKKLIKQHKKKKGVATLVVIPSLKSDRFGTLYVDRRSNIGSILEKPTIKKKWIKTFFAGVHLLDHRFFQYPKKKKKSCIVRDYYIPLLKKGNPIAVSLYNGYWNDMGTLRRLQATSRHFQKEKAGLSYRNHLDKLVKALSNQKNFLKWKDVAIQSGLF